VGRQVQEVSACRARALARPHTHTHTHSCRRGSSSNLKAHVHIVAYLTRRAGHTRSTVLPLSSRALSFRKLQRERRSRERERERERERQTVSERRGGRCTCTTEAGQHAKEKDAPKAFALRTACGALQFLEAAAMEEGVAAAALHDGADLKRIDCIRGTAQLAVKCARFTELQLRARKGGERESVCVCENVERWGKRRGVKVKWSSPSSVRPSVHSPCTPP
jgi:hypothetical protein